MAGPRTQRYGVGLAMFFAATGTISLRADALPTDLPTAVENHNTATTAWVRSEKGAAYAAPLEDLVAGAGFEPATFGL